MGAQRHADADLAAALDRQADQVKGICEQNGTRDVRLAATPQERTNLWIARKKGMANYPKLKQATDILEEAWSSPNWQDVLLKNRTFLEGFL